MYKTSAIGAVANVTAPLLFPENQFTHFLLPVEDLIYIIKAKRYQNIRERANRLAGKQQCEMRKERKVENGKIKGLFYKDDYTGDGN